jgi:hypothetical protein
MFWYAMYIYQIREVVEFIRKTEKCVENEAYTIIRRDSITILYT